MICKHCGAQIPDDSVFCANCGNMVESENTQTRAQSGYCPNCGSPVYEGDTVCSSCGQRLDAYDDTGNAYEAVPPRYEAPRASDRAERDVKKSGSSTTIIVILIVIIAALAGGIIAFFVFRDNFIPEKKDDLQYTITDNGGSVAKKTVKPANTPKPEKTAAPEKTAKPAKTSNPTVPPAQPVKSGVNTNPGTSEYMFASDKKILSQSDLSKLTQAETRLLLNELYARHGYIFQTQEYSDYFSKKTWYTPRYTSQSDAEAQFNDTERQNKNIISEYEKSKGWR